MAQPAEKLPHSPKGAETQRQEKPRKSWFLRVIGRDKPLPDLTIKSTSEIPNPYDPLTFQETTDLRSRLNAMRTNAEPIIDYTANQGAAGETNKTPIAYTETGLTHKEPKKSTAIKKIAIGAAATAALTGAAALAYEATSSDSDQKSSATLTINGKTDSTPPQLTTPDGKQVVIPDASKTPATTAATASPTEAPKPTNTPTPEVKTDVPCQVLPEKFCSQAELIEWTNQQGKKDKGLGFNLPPGTEFYAPISGQILKVDYGQQGLFKGQLIGVSDKNNPNILDAFIGDLQLENTNAPTTTKGNILGRVGSTGINNSGYNLIISLKNGATADENLINELFPGTLNKPIKTVNLNTSASSAIGNPVFSSTPLK